MNPDLLPGPDETCDALTADWRLLQRRKGHRYSTDDLLLAWWALQESPPEVHRYLDLGCGIASVALMVAWGRPTARVEGVEVQEISIRLARRNVLLNRQEHRFSLRHGDLRDPLAAGEEGVFDLVTGSPPYIPRGKAWESIDPQRAAARIEMNGGIEDYCQAASRALADGGIFCAVQPGMPRVMEAARLADLRVLRVREVIPRTGLPPLFALWTLGKGRRSPTSPPEVLPPLLVRDDAGQRTEEMKNIRVAMAMPPCSRRHPPIHGAGTHLIRCRTHPAPSNKDHPRTPGDAADPPEEHPSPQPGSPPT